MIIIIIINIINTDNNKYDNAANVNNNNNNNTDNNSQKINILYVIKKEQWKNRWLKNRETISAGGQRFSDRKQSGGERERSTTYLFESRALSPPPLIF